MNVCMIFSYILLALNALVTILILIFAHIVQKNILAEYKKAKLLTNVCRELLESMQNGESDDRQC